ncbi:DUF6287 domain-containing protein [Lactobacillus sp. ESL0703]|uniref:DUF6287 domain-containing protein n=1 Tax=Lactobacillus sp. ESL0703 TaxID=2983218 RepID=UPI0023F908B7|nr:DUF6287 domain-containing protein [Lactobacillus sp. ESL0703]MDF7668592.1 DUF6287 domain-containing protein [Lactobacillus sp. ESL0703]
MKKYKLIKLLFSLIAFVGMFSNAYQVKADSSIQSSATGKISKNKKMNFSQIKKGNYASLLGKWKEVGAMHNAYDGKGITWYKLNPKYLETLKVTKHRIKLNAGYVVFHGNTMTDENKKKRKLKFSKYRKSLGAVSDGAILWEIDYYPKNVPIYDDKYHRKQPKEIDNKKDRIVISCSNMGSTAVFQRN